MKSIRARLLIGLLGGITLVGLLGGLLLYHNARHTADSVFDLQMRQIALTLRDQPFERSLPPPPRGGAELEDMVVQIWSPAGLRVYLSRPYPRVPGLGQPGYSNPVVDGERWRVFALHARGYVIQVAQPSRLRSQRAAEIALRNITPLFLMLPALGILVWLIVSRALQPLSRLTREVQQQTPEALQPLPEAGLVSEVKPLVGALNGLLAQLGEALQTQRDFVADAAHELRTPLTALRLQVQLAREAPDAQAREEAFAQLVRGVERASRLVEQLLTLARAEASAAHASAPVPVALADIARELVTDYATLAANKGVDLGLTHDEPVVVEGQPTALRTLLANLVDNAVRYTPSGGRVDVSVESIPAGALLRVSDNGPGIPVGERQRVFDRFYRRSGAQVQGTGLGLAIVSRIAERHGAELQLDETPGGGLRASVRFRAGNTQ